MAGLYPSGFVVAARFFGAQSTVQGSTCECIQTCQNCCSCLSGKHALHLTCAVSATIWLVLACIFCSHLHGIPVLGYGLRLQQMLCLFQQYFRWCMGQQPVQEQHACTSAMGTLLMALLLSGPGMYWPQHCTQGVGVCVTSVCACRRSALR
ncbi:hypothetical protein COO60DRAFT_1540382 [Scenedesmus sp. NREL 46B-D3]|nr:hypothetical protein COO60DRAFT_1540382 [Scenedesmus sp. NREL 46B-D3]